VTSEIRRRLSVLWALLGVMVFVAPLVLLIHGSDPKAGASSSERLRVPAADTELSPDCVLRAQDEKSLAAAFGQLQPGQTVCLSSGDYGKFIAGRKDGLVGVRGEEGARVTMAIEFDSVANVHVDDVTIKSLTISGESHDIKIAHSRFTGLALVRADKMLNANIEFDHNVHANIDTCTQCFQGRLHIDGNTGRPAGIVISNSVFSGGNSDGVRADADGIKVINNEFFGLRDQDPFHTDPIQIYGGSHVLVRANYFHDNSVSAQIMMADGGAHNIVEDNVMAAGGYTWAITWFSDVDSVIQHNTLAPGQCENNIRCGMIQLGAKAQDPAGHGTVIRDNVMGGVANHGEAKISAFNADHNLSVVPTPGDRNMTGVPHFRGPLRSYTGYRLEPGSTGTNGASDGSNPGIG
jgi:hypothetical protein